MPPRTRSTTTTAPAGRRPKVAGLRAPGRPGGTGESAAARDSGPEPDDVRTDDAPGVAATTTSDTTVTDTTAPDAAVTDPADAPAADAAGRRETDPGPEGDAPAVAEDAEPAGGAATARPTSKARRTGRTMTPAAEPAARRGGTAVLDRPAPARSDTAGDGSAGGSRLGRTAAVVTRPLAALGANPRRLLTVLVVVLVLSLGLGTWAFLAARSDRADGTSYANEAVVNVGGTAEVVGQTRQAVEQILSYDFTKLDDSVNAAKTQATGEFGSQYLAVFEQTIRGPATEQKLRQTASVLNIGVQQLSSDRASLIALVQFTAERTTNGQTTNAPGLLSVQVVKEDGRWKISELKPV